MLGPLGADVLQTVGGAERALTVREVLDRLNRRRAEPLAYTTVMTVLGRLARQDVLKRTLVGRGYVYEPIVVRPAEIAVRSVIREFGEAAVAHFVDQASAEPRLRERLEKLMRGEHRAVRPED
ncbi:BlaI/MecI/CopY family transcriptional regulator [Amycolatopsis sp. YIM 10]|uniref:BlaI/MecI/CopY family transcriptional regulator n=1 Tax=Amycolatopsis sp. YIM 10 TaxID=2653857 RepID=UPI0012903F52|nr:BlaI/MecI/CopY family transcriptional regulator [Amycolatopsis sp. YIM 10]QFU90574.1 Penicillinase repressor [Amycolatopsis sp. YIM 10]